MLLLCSTHRLNMELDPQSTYRGRVEIGGSVSALSAGVYTTLYMMVDIVKGGWACTPHPHQAWQIFPSWRNVRQKVAIATLCVLCDQIFQVYLGSMCTAVLIGCDPASPHLPPHLGSYYPAKIDDISLWPRPRFQAAKKAGKCMFKGKFEKVSNWRFVYLEPECWIS